MKNTNPNGKRSLHLIPLFWLSVAIASIWAYFIFTDYWIERVFGEKSPYLYASLAVAGLFLLTWLVATLLMYFKVKSVLNPRVSFSILIPSMVIFALISAFNPPTYLRPGSYLSVSSSDVDIWLHVFRASLASVVMISIPLLLLPPMLKLHRGWLRIILVAGVVVAIFQVVRMFESGHRSFDDYIISGYFDNHIKLSDLKSLINPTEFIDGLTFLVVIIGECITRASIGFSLVFAVADTVIWTKRGFITEEEKLTDEPSEVEHDSPSSDQKRATESVTWDCPKCGVTNQNNTYKCKRCKYSLI